MTDEQSFFGQSMVDKRVISTYALSAHMHYTKIVSPLCGGDGFRWNSLNIVSD